MLEDSTASGSHPALAPAAVHEQQPNGTRTDTSCAASEKSPAEGQGHAAFSSAFASFSNVRKGLYELCLSQLACAQVPVGGGDGGGGGGGRHRDVPARAGTEEGRPVQHRPTDDNDHGGDGFANVSSERSAAGARPVNGRGEALPLSGEGEGGDSGGGRGAAKEGVDPRRVLAAGDEWVVREFRRVGASVKAVRVVCRVRSHSRLVDRRSMSLLLVVGGRGWWWW